MACLWWRNNDLRDVHEVEPVFDTANKHYTYTFVPEIARKLICSMNLMRC